MSCKINMCWAYFPVIWQSPAYNRWTLSSRAADLTVKYSDLLRVLTINLHTCGMYYIFVVLSDISFSQCLLFWILCFPYYYKFTIHIISSLFALSIKTIRNFTGCLFHRLPDLLWWVGFSCVNTSFSQELVLFLIFDIFCGKPFGILIFLIRFAK